MQVPHVSAEIGAGEQPPVGASRAVVEVGCRHGIDVFRYPAERSQSSNIEWPITRIPVVGTAAARVEGAVFIHARSLRFICAMRAERLDDLEGDFKGEVAKGWHCIDWGGGTDISDAWAEVVL